MGVVEVPVVWVLSDEVNVRVEDLGLQALSVVEGPVVAVDQIVAVTLRWDTRIGSRK